MDTDMGDAGVVEAKCWEGPWTGVVVPVDVVVMGEPTKGAVLDVAAVESRSGVELRQRQWENRDGK